MKNPLIQEIEKLQRERDIYRAIIEEINPEEVDTILYGSVACARISGKAIRLALKAASGNEAAKRELREFVYSLNTAENLLLMAPAAKDRKQFHQLWTRAVGLEGYDRKAWTRVAEKRGF